MSCPFQIFVARSSVPAPSFTYFLNILVDTIRDEIAACMEKSYDKIHVSEAAKMLRISSVNAVQEYGKKVDVLRRISIYSILTTLRL